MSFSNILDLSRGVFTTGPVISYENINSVATSDCNSYIPVYAIVKHMLISIQNDDETLKNVLEYSKPTLGQGMSRTRSYADLIVGLTVNTNNLTYVFKVGEEQHQVYFERGLLLDIGKNILMCMAIDTEYLLTTDIDVIKANPNGEKFTLFITDKFRDPKYKNVRKKVEAEYIDKVRNFGLDVIETSRIEEKLFKNNVEPHAFKTIAQMKKYLKEVPKLLITDEIG